MKKVWSRHLTWLRWVRSPKTKCNSKIKLRTFWKVLENLLKGGFLGKQVVWQHLERFKPFLKNNFILVFENNDSRFGGWLRIGKMHKAITLSRSCDTYMSNHPRFTHLESSIIQCPILSTLKRILEKCLIWCMICKCMKRTWFWK